MPTASKGGSTTTLSDQNRLPRFGEGRDAARLLVFPGCAPAWRPNEAGEWRKAATLLYLYRRRHRMHVSHRGEPGRCLRPADFQYRIPIQRAHHSAIGGDDAED